MARQKLNSEKPGETLLRPTSYAYRENTASVLGQAISMSLAWEKKSRAGGKDGRQVRLRIALHAPRLERPVFRGQGTDSIKRLSSAVRRKRKGRPKKF